MDGRYPITLAALYVLCGCATTPVPTSQAPGVPRERVLRADLLQYRSGYGQVIVKRDEGIQMSACHIHVLVNGAKVAELAAGEKLVIYLPVGDQMLGATTVDLCFTGTVEARASVSAAAPAVYRVGFTRRALQLQPTAF